MRTPRGFTLIELLIVVIVMGTLVALSVSHFSDADDQETQTRLRSDAQTLSLRIEAQFQRTGKYPTNATVYGSTSAAYPGLTATAGTQWALQNVTADQRGAAIVVQDVFDPTHSCAMGLGTLSYSSPLTCQ